MLSVAKASKTSHVREFVPSVIEPSFGIGRILYCILETNFKVRRTLDFLIDFLLACDDNISRI